MQTNQAHRLGGYLRSLPVALERAGWITWALFGCWLCYPTLAVTLAHVQDAAGLPYYLWGELVPREFPEADMQRAGLVVVGLCLFLLVVNFVLVVKFYRRTSIGIPLWPVALILVGGLLNFVWWLDKGYFDPQGAIAGMIPVVVMGIFEKFCEKLGHAFVFGDDGAGRHGEL